MNDWELLTKHAILGTERQAFSLPKTQSPSLSAQLETKEPAEKLLHSAALLSEYRRIGRQPISFDEKPPLVPSQAETLPQCTAVELLRSILQEDNSNLQSALIKEWLRLLQAAEQRVPFDLLPILLDKAKQEKNLWPYLKHTMGQRGHWLSQLNPDWQVFSETMTDVQDERWDSGSHAARLSYLQQVRATVPTKARELLAATWQQETAQARQAFLALFWSQLSLDDEAFLENCLKDRSQIVRQLAAQMLGSLESRFLKQVLERLSTYFSVKTTLEIKLPMQYDKTAWVGIKEKPPSSSKMGEKAWWLYQMLLLVRPTFLLAYFDLSADSYLKILRRTDFADMLSNALTVATQIHKDQSVATVLVRQKANVFLQTLTDLADVFSEKERDSLLQDYLKTSKAFTTWPQMKQLVDLFPNGLSINLSQSLLSTSLPRLLKQKNNYGYAEFMSLAAALAPSCYEKMSNKWLSDKTHPATEEFLKIYEFRAQMTQELTQ
ncbi:hypothetical protein PN36_12720 [Candidatus Thiomargarita nelsonii]|uniref:Uncharacterized protein n=1 Tax=Candidatus Thiomargarita nelsonii TaxID=1003181 RepID=A0A0A6PFU1_9GAMM|nr:hypothetical protein PN36_12720 [Candidatus Thiomargarita nelsonii]